MVSIIFLLSLLLLGPLALLLGADSRDRDERDQRGWWPGSSRTGTAQGGRAAPANDSSLASAVWMERVPRPSLPLVRSQHEPLRVGECAAAATPPPTLA